MRAAVSGPHRTAIPFMALQRWNPLLTLVAAAACATAAHALGEAPWVQATVASGGSVDIANSRQAAPIVVDPSDWPGVARAANDLRDDLHRVTGIIPEVEHAVPRRDAIVIGTLGHSPLIDHLVAAKQIDVTAIRGKWEATLKVVVDHQLLIIGSDKRGTIYGIYDLSEAAGVSPWYWWADVPPQHHAALSVAPGRWLTPSPAVKYRGIFLNDEAPALTGWAREKFGGLNHRFYAHVFELLLRLRANYLWPAMWDNCFSEDDPANPREADAAGIVMGTSHVEPMMRADKEWNRAGYTAEQWNYQTHAEDLRKFWTAGIERNAPEENIVTIAMRGKIDTPMSADTNIALLERIVHDQRVILAQHLKADVTQIPQLWALYKEVQDYYDQGMRVPDDVTLLWSDDNWGNLRRVPTAAERRRTGGAGVYYHFDYVGGPRSYKWLNTNPITKIWEQMNLADQYGARRIWIVNVGDLKPMEFPIEFFLRMAWNPADWPYSRLPEFGRDWAAREFGPEHAAEIADLVAAYTKYNGRRKPELLAPTTFSLEHYQEASRVEHDWNDLAARAERLNAQLPANARDAYFQLVLYPVKACAIVNELLIAAGRNELYARQGRPSANAWAERTKALFAADAALSAEYNHRNHGRWDHMMDQTHLGYTGWHDPKENQLPPLAAVTPLPHPALGIDPGPLHSSHAITLFNRGSGAVTFTVETSAAGITASPAAGTLRTNTDLTVRIRQSGPLQAPSITIRGDDGTVRRIALPDDDPGYIAIEAEHYARAVDGDGIHWTVLPDFGRTLSGVTTFPVTAAPAVTPSAHLDYPISVRNGQPVRLHLVVAPTLNFQPGRGLRCAVSLDDDPPQIVDLMADRSLPAWETAVSDAVREVVVPLTPHAAGPHVLKFWRVDPGVTLERLVIDTGGLESSYLGPIETGRSPPAGRAE